MINSSEQDVDGWKVSLVFPEDIDLSDGWNGAYKTEGDMLSISAVDYNRQIPAGGEISDIGFIVSGKTGPFLTEE